MSLQAARAMGWIYPPQHGPRVDDFVAFLDNKGFDVDIEISHRTKRATAIAIRRGDNVPWTRTGESILEALDALVVAVTA